jgi:hypothetical protein
MMVGTFIAAHQGSIAGGYAALALIIDTTATPG